MHVSIFYGVIDRVRGVLRYANAGHPLAFLVPGDGGEPVRLKATAPPLGLSPDKRIKGSRRGWKTGTDLLLLASDGITETAGAGAERYGDERLLGVVRRSLADGLDAQSIVNAVFADLESFAPGAAADDRTLLVVRG
jgi:sigma-B regulation protein RsbU (phosphoserine phosphatase)